MKKTLFVLLVLCLSFSVFAQGAKETTKAEETYAIAMITDYGDITDQSFNQTTYEACKAYADANGIRFQYYKPAGNNTPDRVTMVEKAISEGYNIIVMPGYAFAGTIVDAAPRFKDIKFVALDVAKGDLLEASVPNYDYNPDKYNLTDYVDLSNVYCIVYQEEVAGYLAGYATVALGYTELGFCGGMAVPAVIRYGYGFVQGADAAAAKLGKTGTIQYTYANQFFGDADITAAMDAMYSKGAQIVFACGGGVYTSVAEAAAKVNGKIVGVDVDQMPIIDGYYGAGMTVTSAMKGLYASTYATLKLIIEDNGWNSVVGTIANLGLISGSDVESNYVGIPLEGTQWSDSFTKEDYIALVNDIYSGKVVVSNDITVSAADNAKVLTVKDLGNIK